MALTALLFVTADVHIDTINEVLMLGNSNSQTATFILLSSPDQEMKDKYTAPPVDDFKTSFSSWSVKKLGEYVQARYRKRKTQEQNFYYPNTIAVLDERSAKDRTINIGQYTNDTKKILEDPDYGPPPEWQSVRIRFEDVAESVACAMLKEFLLFGPESVELVDENGVWNIPSQKQ